MCWCEKNPYKALSFAKRASTSDSPLVLQLLTTAPLEVTWKAGGSVSISIFFSATLTISFSITLSLSSQELWPAGFLYLRPDSEHTATLDRAVDGWPSGSLWASLAWGAFTTAELAFIFCRERDLCKGVLLFSVSGKQQTVSTSVGMRELSEEKFMSDRLGQTNGSKGLFRLQNSSNSKKEKQRRVKKSEEMENIASDILQQMEIDCITQIRQQQDAL